MVDSIRKLAASPEGQAALRQLGDVEGFTAANDGDYAELRRLLAAHGKAIEDMVPGGWKLHLRASPELPSVP